MPLQHLIDLEPGINSFQKINATMDQVDTNTSNISTNTSAIATNTSNIATNTTNISTLQGQMTTAQSDITGKQNKNALSTLVYGYKTASGTYSLDGADLNYIIDITNVGASDFNCLQSSSVPTFTIGGKVVIYNNTASTNNITIKAGAGATLRTSSAFPTTIAPGASATVVMIQSNTYLRIQ